MDDLAVIKSQLAALEAELAEMRDWQAQQLVPPPLPPVMDEPVLLRPGFKVEQIAINKVSIAAGYAQTQTGDLTSVSAIATLTVSAATHVWARYDRGVFGDGPQWEVPSSSIIQTGSSLPTWDARYVVYPIAEIGWNGTDSAITNITQHHVGTLPCPDMELPGKVVPFNVPYGTTKYGWKPCDGIVSTVDLRKKFISGAHGGGNLAGGAETTTITAAALMAAQGGHTHPLILVETPHVQPWDPNLGGPPIVIDQWGAYTLDDKASFTSDLTADIIPPNVAMPFYEHL